MKLRTKSFDFSFFATSKLRFWLLFCHKRLQKKICEPTFLKLRWEVGFRFSISEQDRHLKIHNALFQLRSSTTMKSFQRSEEGQIPGKSITSRKEISSCQDCKHFHLVSAANQFSRRRGRGNKWGRCGVVWWACARVANLDFCGKTAVTTFQLRLQLHLDSDYISLHSAQEVHFHLFNLNGADKCSGEGEKACKWQPGIKLWHRGGFRFSTQYTRNRWRYRRYKMLHVSVPCLTVGLV